MKVPGHGRAVHRSRRRSHPLPGGWLVGIAHRPPRAIRQGLQPMLLVAIEDLVAGLARYAELPTQMAHLLAFQQASHKPQAFVHTRNHFPRHRHLPPAIAAGWCYPCVRYKTSPMSQVGHTFSRGQRHRATIAQFSAFAWGTRCRRGTASETNLMCLEECLCGRFARATHCAFLDFVCNAVHPVRPMECRRRPAA